MKQTEKQHIIDRYNARLIQYGDDPRTLAVGPEERREIRYQVLCDVGLISGCSVLDIGCGFGDLFAYLERCGIQVDYTGYDINPKLLDVARAKYPDARFEVTDIEIDPFPNFDFIVSSTSFNLRLTEGDNYDFIGNMLRICHTHAKHGVAIDLLSSYVDFETPEAFHYNPERVFSIAKKITKRVCLRHDYPLYEFCIYMYPDFTGWQTRNANP